jgi:phosphoserine phosphatase
MDLVVQSEDLSTDALTAFRVALDSPHPKRKTNAARLGDLEGSAQDRKIAAALAQYWKCDASFVPASMPARAMRALVMDMDSTLVTIEGIDELARMAGKGEEVAAITAAAMRGELVEYSESLQRRVALLAGCDAGLVERVRRERLKTSPGVKELIEAAREFGWKTLIVSGGFTVIAKALQDELGIDEICANELEIRDGKLTGLVRGPEAHAGRIVDGAGKARALEGFCERNGCTAKQAIAVGDGANDLDMMAIAGVSVAYHAKPIVQTKAKYALSYTGLDGIPRLFSDTW